MPFLLRIVIALSAAALLFASLSVIATFGAVLIVISVAVLWMSFVYLLAERLAPRRFSAERRLGTE